MTAEIETRDAFRRQMPIAGKLAYFDHAAVAPISGPAHQAIEKWLDEAASQGIPRWPAWERELETTRATAAGLIGASPDEIALVPNTTWGIAMIAEGYPWQSGDNVVTVSDEFPSNVYPWMNLQSRGVETRLIAAAADGQISLDAIAAACDQRTRIVSISWVGFGTGCRRDLAEIAACVHELGGLLFVDAIQGLGVLPLDVTRIPIDFLAADGHKWMLGPEGAGLAYIRRQHRELIRPLHVGWHSVVHEHDYGRLELTLKDSAARHEGGSQNMAGMLGLGASLKMLQELGIQSIERSVIAYTEQVITAIEAIGGRVVSPRSAKNRSGIVCFDMPGDDLPARRRACQREGVVLSYRSGYLRVSPHAYNDDDDLERLIDALRH